MKKPKSKGRFCRCNRYGKYLCRYPHLGIHPKKKQRAKN